MLLQEPRAYQHIRDGGRRHRQPDDDQHRKQEDAAERARHEALEPATGDWLRVIGGLVMIRGVARKAIRSAILGTVPGAVRP
jgi:hypothetical protein